jgi:uncharacterized membrane protein
MSSPRLLDSLPHLVEKGLILPEQADRIKAHYSSTQNSSGDRLLLLSSIVGALLIGLGLILVVAHNWEDLGRGTRTFFAFLPLLIGQALVLFALLRKNVDRGWREGSSIFLLLAVGACIALISQIYHIPGELDSFLFTWALLVVPLLYVPRSAISFMLYLALITGYGLTYKWGDLMFGEVRSPYLFLALLAIAIPHYLHEARTRGRSTGFFWSSIFLALSIAIGSQLFWLEGHIEIILAVAGMAAAFILLPRLLNDPTLRLGPFRFFGSLAMIGLLIFGSYADVWDVFDHGNSLRMDLLPLIIQLFIGAMVYILTFRKRSFIFEDPLAESAIVLIVAYLISFASAELAALLVNLWMLFIGIQYVRSGTRQDSLWRLNLGLALIGSVILLRFFDLDINDALKGVVFILIGIGFLGFNVRLIRSRKKLTDA